MSSPLSLVLCCVAVSSLLLSIIALYPHLLSDPSASSAAARSFHLPPPPPGAQVNISDDPLNFYSAPISSSDIASSATVFALDVETVCFRPRVQLFHGMVEPGEASTLVARGDAAVSAAGVGGVDGASVPFSYSLDAQDPTVARILARLAHAAMVSVETLAGVRLERHAPGVTYPSASEGQMDTLNFDDYDTIVAAAARGGQRFATIRVFLNDIATGGHLHFPDADCSSLAKSIDSSRRMDEGVEEDAPVPSVPSSGLVVLPTARLGVLYHVLTPSGNIERRSTYRQLPVQGSVPKWELVVHIHETKMTEGVARLFKELERTMRRNKKAEDEDEEVIELV